MFDTVACRFQNSNMISLRPGAQFEAQRICHRLRCLSAKTLAGQVVLGEHPHLHLRKSEMST
jgi:hypothetical protein